MNVYPGGLDVRSRHVWASAEAEALAYREQGLKATGLSRMTFYSQNLDRSKESASIPPHARIRTERGRLQEVDTARTKVLAIGAGSIGGTSGS